MGVKTQQIAFIFSIFATVFARDSYVATVLDYSPTLEKFVNETIFINLENYLDDIDNSPSDIIVFPEYGLTGIDIFANGHYKTFAVEIPEPNPSVRLCKNIDDVDVISRFACLIQERRIYVVVNLIEKSNNDYYSTNVVFGRAGNIIAKYRKINLDENEKRYLKSGQNMVTFVTDFDVVFTTITCRDVLYKFPSLDVLESNVTDVAVTCVWHSELPLFTSLSLLNGYAKRNGINVLSSGYGDPASSIGGSGIYNAIMGLTSTVTPRVKAVQRISTNVQKLPTKIPFDSCGFRLDNDNDRVRGIGIMPDAEAFKPRLVKDIHRFKFESIINDNNRYNKIFCGEKVCCNFDIIYDDDVKFSTNVFYKAMVYETKENQFACGLKSCDTDDPASCGSIYAAGRFSKISIGVNFDSTKRLPIFPLSVDTSFEPFNFKYCESNGYSNLTTSRKRDVVMMGIYFEGFTTSSSAAVQINAIFFFSIGISYLLAYLIF